MQRIEYFRGGRLYKSYDYSLATLERNEIQPDDVEVWNNEEIIVPYFHPQNTAYCRNIVASYHLMVSIFFVNTFLPFFRLKHGINFKYFNEHF